MKIKPGDSGHPQQGRRSSAKASAPDIPPGDSCVIADVKPAASPRRPAHQPAASFPPLPPFPLTAVRPRPTPRPDAPPPPPVRRGGSNKTDARAAVADLRDQIGGAAACVLVFFSPAYDRGEMLAALKEAFGSTPVFGCTTAGEITPFGYISGGLSGVSFPAKDFLVHSALFENLSQFQIADTIERTHRLVSRRHAEAQGRPGFGLLLVDGLSTREEQLVSAIGNALAGLPLIGGSAGDGLDFKSTVVLHGGRFVSDAAILLLITTRRPFSVFKTEHFVPTEHKMVVTGADLETRRVFEINAEPAALEYARLVGLSHEALTPKIFAAHPVVVRVGGQYHVRAIQKVNPDNSLTFHCAIDEGLVLTVARGIDIVENLHELFRRLEREIGPLDAIVGFDCVLRNLETEQRNLKAAVSDLFVANRVTGFCTYGEQYMSMHVNQTFTGVAIGRT
ncbi:nitric oxide-sensing protein NosP [Nitrospirillum sp. BR 11828]|uniref:nitric oxide-sensing protein NosP n=1 Tax=Nitrospirillum sp. BR 11828 TaxID=3104325 RepID=UPI002ACAFC94|nr:nitric oxide-sensing protein NosP [Nitrospirillum sp. BR 11828]MDZ5645908.1 nitric oxide-sensing protein NosP [Nitrospirillum sp. BR 11828]